MKKIFLSFPHGDHHFNSVVNFLRNRLSLHGIEIESSESSDVGLDNLQKSFTAQIDRCSIFICAFEPSSSFTTLQLGYALGKNKNILLISDYQDVPFDLRNIAWINRNFDLQELESRILELVRYDEIIPEIIPISADESSVIAIQKLVNVPDLIDKIEPSHLENILMSWFVERGYEVESKDATFDAGVDFIVNGFGGGNAVVEVKRYKPTSQVPVSVVRQLAGTMMQLQMSHGIVISSVPFSNSAIHFAHSMEPPIYLWTLEDILRMETVDSEYIEKNDDDWRIINWRNIKSPEDLKRIVVNLQNDLACNVTMLNGDIVTFMEVDLIIRNAVRASGIEAWNDNYFKSNLSGMPGNDVVDKTLNYINYLKKNGLNKNFEGADFPMRNLKHLFDHASDDLIEPLIYNISKTIEEWLAIRKRI